MKKCVFGFGVVVVWCVVLGAAGEVRGALDSPVIEPPEVTRSYAESGDPTAQFNLALQAAKGEPPNMAEAVGWYRKAAGAGFPPAQFNLGILLGRGEGVAKDEKEAVKWFYEAGKQGLFEAQKALIECYSKGVGVEKNPAVALTWDFLARRSLELRYEQSAGEPPRPPKLRADGFAEFMGPDGKVVAVGPDGAGMPATGIPATGPQMRRTPPPGSVPANMPGAVQILPGRRIGPGGEAMSVYRQKVPINAQLEELAKLERDARHFAGATEQDYEKARASATGYVFTLSQSPQKPQSGNWLNQRITLNAAPPPPPPLRELPDDRSKVHPLGLYGREIIQKYHWKHAETEHFVVHYTQAADAYPVMRFIECGYFFVTQTLMIDDSKSKRKSHVFVFPDTATWAGFTSSKGMSAAVAGFAYKDELLLGAHDEKDTYLKVLCHEATHAIVARFYAGRRWPLWLNEGFADYMAAKTLSLRRGHKIERYLSSKVDRVDVNAVFNRIRYGDTTTANGTSEVVAFYGQSEKCVRTLLEKLPAGGFPKFANLVFAGNAMPVSLREAYLEACPDLGKFETLVNAP